MEMPGMIERRTRRKNYFIDKKFQTNFILKFCLLTAATGIFVIAVLYLLANKATTVSFVNSRVVVQTTADFLFPILIQTSIVAIVIVSIATIFFTLFVSHRIAGPAYRFKKILSSIGEGDFSGECRIRRTDSLQDVAEAIDAMMANLRKNFVTIDTGLNKLKDRLEDLSNRSGEESPELKELKKAVLELDKALKHFKF